VDFDISTFFIHVNCSFYRFPVEVGLGSSPPMARSFNSYLVPRGDRHSSLRGGAIYTFRGPTPFGGWYYDLLGREGERSHGVHGVVCAVRVSSGIRFEAETGSYPWDERWQVALPLCYDFISLLSKRSEWTYYVLPIRS